MSARYDVIGRSYATKRQPDARIAARIDAALGSARSVLNVGAGTGSYEPRERRVLAVEPSTVMIDQRPAVAAPVIRAVAEALPVADRSFDAALAVLSVHHWSDIGMGLGELRRVAPRQVILTWDPRVSAGYWLVAEYLPEIVALEGTWNPIAAVREQLDVETVEPVLVPADCTDGFLAAYWQRPSAYLERDVRAAISGLALLDPAVVAAAMQRLESDLDTGEWHDRHRDLLALDELDAGYRLVTARSR